MAKITDYKHFYDPTLGDAIINSDIPYPGGSQAGWIVESIGPGERMYTFADGEVVITDDFGNILG